MNDQLKDLASDLRERAMTYSFLARVLSDEQIGTDFLAALACDVPVTGTDLDAFAAGLATADLESVRKDLAADHSALLLAMSTHAVSPYESVYTSEEHLMMQAARDEVVAAYASSGFAKAGEYHVPEDHISLELDFMAALGNRAANAVDTVLAAQVDTESDPLAEAERDMNAQIDFLERHLFVWAPQFCDELEKRAATPFYRGVSQMLRTFIDQERAYVAQLNEAQKQA